MYESILVPVDGSKLAERALSIAIPLAEQHGARLTLFHAHEPMMPITLAGGAPVTAIAAAIAWWSSASEASAGMYSEMIAASASSFAA